MLAVGTVAEPTYSCSSRPRPSMMKMEEAFADLMEKFVTPITVLVGLLGNVLSICVLRKKEIQASEAGPFAPPTRM